MTRNQALAAFIKGVHDDLGAYAQLKDLLEEQFSVALTHNAEKMRAVTTAIEQAVSGLDASRRDRASLLAALGVQRAAIEEVLPLVPPEHRAKVAGWWAQLEALVVACRSRNVRNAHVMVAQHEVFRRVLSSEPDTYAPA